MKEEIFRIDIKNVPNRVDWEAENIIIIIL